MNIRLPKLFNYQKLIYEFANNGLIVFKKGRQVGGSYMNLILCFKWLFQKDETICYVTPTYKLSRDFFFKLAKRIPSRFIDIKNASDLKIQTTFGSTIQFFSAESYETVRGFTFTRQIIDEAALISDAAYYEVLRPTMDIKGKTTIVTSTPRTKSGFFYDLYLRATEDDSILLVEANIHDNPMLSESKKKEIESSLPARAFRQEYLAEFSENGSGLFAYKNSLIPDIEDFTTGPVVYGGLDLGKKDKTVLTLLNDKGYMIGLYEWSDMSYTAMTNLIIEKCKKHNCKILQVESNSIGDAIIDILREKVGRTMKIENFFTSNNSKNLIFEDLMVAFEQDKIKIFDRPKLLNQLDGISTKYNATTRTLSYVNERNSGGHSDMVMSLAFAYNCLKTKSKLGSYTIR